MEEGIDTTGELSLTIVNAPESGPQTNAISRDPTDLREDDKVNVFIRNAGSGDTRQSLEVNVPAPGGSTTLSFVVSPGDYDVDLLGYEQFTSKNSARLAATTGDAGNVTVSSGEVSEVDFQADNSDSDAFTKFGFSFDVGLEFRANAQQVAVNFTDGSGNATGIPQFIDPARGGIGIDPDGIATRDRSKALDVSGFTGSTDNSTIVGEDIKLVPGKYKGGTASVLLGFRIGSELVGSDQNPTFAYNNPNGDEETGVNIEGDGGIIITF
ncbi:hypothetical protein [Salinibacter altiplanensis]|uniref:hypothetical protein n=1 Tax=Salinibacter altiplanensis TaxID=1803181 RepID=UPI000C9EE8CA|nr:hypothetical protein [Salinibacter altiplanensis]